MMLRGWTAWVVPVVVLVTACGGEEPLPEGIDPFEVAEWGPSTILRNTQVVFEGQGFVPPEVGQMSLRISGSSGPGKIERTDPLTYIDAQSARWTVPAEFVSAALAGGNSFQGEFRLERRISGYSQVERIATKCVLSVFTNIEPVLQSIEPSGTYLGEELAVRGGNLLLPGEGQSLLFLSGQFHVQSPPMVKSIPSTVVPLSVDERERGRFVLTPDKFGVYPGKFVGSAHLENFVDGEVTMKGDELGGIEVQVYRPGIDSFSPDVVRRGQLVHVTGRGFVANDPVGETATLILLDGVFQADSGKQMDFQGKDVMVLFPEAGASAGTLEIVLRVMQGVDGNLTGLGLIPGVFTGNASVQVFYGGDSFVGDDFPFTLRVAAQLQMVYVKYLPSFDKAFDDFGMSAVRDEVKTGIIERCNSIYSAFNVQFVSERPEDFADYSVIELSGEDPNGANLLGLDNTTGKDINNLRFNDIVGGKNAETEERGFYAYGGVFLKSFLMFSPQLSKGQTALASSRFDDIFSPFVPALGGKAIEAGEYPGGGRSAKISEAIRVLSNLVGGTVAHEVGHSLGLAMVPGHPEEYHNIGDNPAWLMDAGNYRPFDERAEIDGKGPEVFSAYNHDYLQSILPRD